MLVSVSWVPTMKSNTLTRRYARALFQIAEEKKKIEEFHNDLAIFAHILETYPEWAEIFRNPLLSVADKYALVDSLSPEYLKSKEVLDFLHLLIQKKREGIFPGVRNSWQKLYDEFHKQIPVEVTVAAKLSAEQEHRLAESLEQRIGRKPLLNITENPALLGGMIVKYEDKVIDGSVLRQIQQLAAEIKQIPVAKLRGEEN